MIKRFNLIKGTILWDFSQRLEDGLMEWVQYPLRKAIDHSKNSNFPRRFRFKS
jgi:hypothetical protein